MNIIILVSHLVQKGADLETIINGSKTRPLQQFMEQKI